MARVRLIKRFIILSILLILSNFAFSSELYLSGNVADGTGVYEDGDIMENGLVVAVYYAVDDEVQTLSLPEDAVEIDGNKELEAAFDLTGTSDAGPDHISIYITAKTNNSKQAEYAIQLTTGGWIYKGESVEAVEQDPITISQAATVVQNPPVQITSSSVENGVNFKVISPASNKVLEETLLGRSVLSWQQSAEYLAGDYEATITIAITPGSK